MPPFKAIEKQVPFLQGEGLPKVRRRGGDPPGPSDPKDKDSSDNDKGGH